MRVLLVKTSSLGDVLHALPAVTDASAHIPGIALDWLVEEDYAEIPGWHPAVAEVVPVALRRWRRRPWRAHRSGEPARLYRRLRAGRYAAVIDAQGLIKSAVLARLAPGERHGLDWRSAREPLASLAYRHCHRVPWGLHAVERVRQLLAAALGYPPPTAPPRYEIAEHLVEDGPTGPPYVVFLHATTWPTKHWPEPHWSELARTALSQGLGVRLPWGTPEEEARAERLARGLAGVEVLPRQGLGALARVLARAAGVVAVDTGLGHLVAALGVPCVSLYGATDPARTGTLGSRQVHLVSRLACAPCLRRDCAYRGPPTGAVPACYAELPPARVWEALLGIMEGGAEDP